VGLVASLFGGRGGGVEKAAAGARRESPYFLGIRQGSRRERDHVLRSFIRGK